MARDRIMVFDGLFKDLIQPDKLHVLSIAPLVDEMRESDGGVAANIAYNLALLGQRSTLLASIGQDARDYLAKLEKMGVDVSKVHFSEKHTASFSVLTDKADCQVGGFYPGAMADATSLQIAPYKAEEVFVVISPHDPAQMITQVKECVEYHKRLFFDVGQQIFNLDKKDILTGIKAAELLILNDYELASIMKKLHLNKREIIEMVKIVIITKGATGCELYQKNANILKVKAVKLDQVVDPTGAGDAFRAGFIYAYLRNLDLEFCARLANVCASFVVEQHGTQEHHFTLYTVKKRFEETYHDKFILEI